MRKTYSNFSFLFSLARLHSYRGNKKQKIKNIFKGVNYKLFIFEQVVGFGRFVLAFLLSQRRGHFYHFYRV